jgi:hypothetical protein
MIHRPPPGTAIRATNPGDIVELAAGDYPPIRWGALANGSASAPTTVRGVPGTRIVSTDGGPCIDQGSPSHITFDTMELIGSVDAAVGIMGSGGGVTLRGLRTNGPKRGIVFDTNENASPPERRTGDVVEGCRLSGHELTGIFAAGCDGMKIIRNWLQANSQCVYFGEDCGPLELVGNVGDGGSQATFAVRPGGVIRHNVAFNVSCGIAVGKDNYRFPTKVTADITENVILAGTGTVRCIAFHLCATKGVRMTNNVVAHANAETVVPRVLSQELNNFGEGCEGTVEVGTRIHDWNTHTVCGDNLQALYTSRGSPMPVQTGVRAAFSRGGGSVVSA